MTTRLAHRHLDQARTDLRVASTIALASVAFLGRPVAVGIPPTIAMITLTIILTVSAVCIHVAARQRARALAWLVALTPPSPLQEPNRR